MTIRPRDLIGGLSADVVYVTLGTWVVRIDSLVEVTGHAVSLQKMQRSAS
jgi:hypothetical protein